ncbi:putative polyvalent protein kinase domain-containing protein [Deminuibacter soli]|uniref:Uncharacterized protein n=1 Tax=Deminuibacter soli TaxID=2291815 RepID=A0A3E1NE38_9BACT|nr:hypothetical protein [Deminuibacter soli]RFM26220.1 hypothetical protein DXN05_21735 [Deminuibacter soli]
MIADDIRQKLQNIIRGELQERPGDSCTAIRNLLCQSFGTSATNKSEFADRAILKEKQTGFLKNHTQNNHLWLNKLPSGSRRIAAGGESIVYLAHTGRQVIKTNDASYYATWTEFFTSLCLHNLFFPNTGYSLLGFTENENQLLAVLQQPFIEGENAALEAIEELLNFNGFAKSRRQDYYNNEFNLALEDMHDENVLNQGDILFFIDTVFYIMG